MDGSEPRKLLRTKDADLRALVQVNVGTYTEREAYRGIECANSIASLVNSLVCLATAEK